MKTYARKKTLEEVREVCAEKGWDLDTTKFDEEGSDYVAIRWKAEGESGELLLSTFNGRFFGPLDSGEMMSSDEDRDGDPWFEALCDAFYVEADEAVSA